MYAELKTETPHEIGGFALYLATTYAWTEGHPRLVTAAADINAAWWTVRAADVSDELTVSQSSDSALVRLLDATDGTVVTTIVPAPAGMLDHHTPTLAEARTIPLAARWVSSKLFTGQSMAEPESADRYEVRDLLVRAARRGETVATSPDLIIVRDTENRPVAFLRDGWHPQNARPSAPGLSALLKRRRR
ncbi:hypothetical protein ABZT27_37835 [Streptomyces sp. NPDC005389]|uniref:hypothetical protein n=1 Tax=Streptomyces sp. NPDC005389 TaxID=3157040 RepID=UPI00339FEB7E